MGNVDAERFATLLHAYGRATDTPGHLAALRDGDEKARSAALDHLWSAVIHQGTPWTATPPTAAAVAGMLTDPRLAATDRVALLRFLAAVAEACQPGADADLAALAHPAGRDVDAELAALLAAGDDETLWEDGELADAMFARAVLGCHEVQPAVFAAAAALLTDRDPLVRGAAAHTSTVSFRLLDQPPDALADRLTALAAAAGPDERAALVLAMGELGLAPRQHLADPHPGVRACAALAPALAADDAATAEILAALVDPAACDDWFAERPPQFPARIRFTLVAAALDRVEGFDRLLPAAVAVARIAGKHSVNFDWGPLLLAAFPEGAPPDRLPEAPRRYLAALVDNDELWDPRHGNASLVFRQAGLPYDRAACRSLATR